MTQQLTTAKARLRLPARGKPYFTPTVTPGISLGYRRLDDRAGSWSARVADGKGGNRIEMIGIADDLEPANGRDVLTFAQAADKARAISRDPSANKLTVGGALDLYEADLLARGGLAGNVSRVRHHLPKALAGKAVADLVKADLNAFRAGIKAKAATVNRTIRILKTALNQAAEGNSNLSTSAWQFGLKQLPNRHIRSRNVVMTDAEVLSVIRAAYADDEAFGLFVEVAAVTGARPSQIAALQVRHLQTARLMMPPSKKGTNADAKRPIPIVIPAALAAKLAVVAAGRGQNEPLLLRTQGDAWNTASNDHRRPFAAAVERAGLDPKVVTIYALRHSSIVRRICSKDRIALITIAKLHDTSVKMIENHYADYIHEFDEDADKGLLDTSAPAADNVIAMRK